MKVLSLLQPWATLVVIGAKKIETRSWNTKYRGKILIHASMKRNISELVYFGSNWSFDAAFHLLGGTMTSKESIDLVDDLPFGSIIGSVELIDTRTTGSLTVDQLDDKNFPPGVAYKYWTERHLGDYSPGRYGWLLSDPIQFKTPTPAKGALSLWEFDESFLLP